MGFITFFVTESILPSVSFVLTYAQGFDKLKYESLNNLNQINGYSFLFSYDFKIRNLDDSGKVSNSSSDTIYDLVSPFHLMKTSSPTFRSLRAKVPIPCVDEGAISVFKYSFKYVNGFILQIYEI